MGFTKSLAASTIKTLQAMYQRGQKLEFELRYANETDSADKVWAATERLGHEIDVLIGVAIQDWLDQAAAAITALDSASDALKQSIQNIQQTIADANKVVKAIGYIDDAVAIAVKLAKYV